MPDLTCRELVELVTEYLEGAMPPHERARFDAHLGDCPDCLVYLEQMRQTLAAVGSLTEEQVAAEARDALLSVFRTWRATRSQPHDA